MTALDNWYHGTQQIWSECQQNGDALVVALPVETPPPPSMGLLPEEELHKMRFRLARDRAGYALGRMLVRWILMPAATPEHFSTRPGGKPFLPGRHSFNISHGAGILAVVFHKDDAIGIDVESTTRLDRPEELFDMVCHPDEKHYLRSLHPRDRKTAFLCCWTRKEAVLKAAGLGLIDDLPNLNICLDSSSPVIAEPIQTRIHDVPLPFADCLCSLALPTGTSGFKLAIYRS